ncbi:Serine/threonine-protein kinase fray2 [Favolaschia claudopus]|uniref:non-specific serine/threonine protein kinase n=1 Tax=Favolaschia claudopus TaxID=2862362 RepID=A0AAW0EJ39_9AGAR
MAPTLSSAPGGKSATRNMPSVSQRFIGAVEDEWDMFSDVSTDYTVGAPIGFGASSIVYAAEYRPQHKPAKSLPCALKVVDLDFLPPHSLALLQRETTLMSLSKHPNVLRVRGSWMDGHKLYIALRLMNRGSAADVMRYGWPGGMEEDVCRCILQQALEGLNYLHVNGFIHRDVKAANLLIDDDGTVLLGDLGVAADLAEDTSRHPASSSKKPKLVTAEAAVVSHGRNSSSSSGHGHGLRHISFEGAEGIRPKIGKRKSFVGTPCWMAPEVIQARHYDSSADIWSFGITALELTQGRPPRSRESTQRILLKTIQEEPPTLDREGGVYKYSRGFKEMVERCLVKDPSKRPSAAELLESPFFKSTKKKSHLVGAILKDLPPLTQRQERRVARGGSVHGTIDSWDFGTALNSPTALRFPEDIGITQETLFEMEGEQRSTSRRSQLISLAERAVPESEEPETENETENEGPLSSSDPPSDADPEFLDVPGSSSSMSSPTSPAASSLMSAELTSISPLPPSAVPVPVSKPLTVPQSPGSASSPGSSAGPLSSSLTSSKSSPGLWKKIKSATGTLRKPSGPVPGSPIGKAKS